MNKNYYCLSLNGCKDTDIHYVSTIPHTVIRGVNRVMYMDDLSTLEEDFMDYDDTIQVTENGYYVEGSFPVIGFEENGKIYDAISGLHVPKEPIMTAKHDFSFNQKHPAGHDLSKYMVSNLDVNAKENYVNTIFNLKYGKKQKPVVEYYYITTEKGIIFAYTENDKMYEMFTDERIIIDKPNQVSRLLAFNEKDIHKVSGYEVLAPYINEILSQDQLETYLTYLHKLKVNCIFNYNCFVKDNKEKTSKEVKVKKRTI